MQIIDKKPIIIITGPTAVGKTELSIALAKTIHGEIISADSMQVYKMMDIGTAKINKDEMDGIEHYLIDILDPKENFNVVTFQNLAKSAVDKIYQKNKIPIVVGGTGFYIQSLLYDISFEETNESNFRQELITFYNQNGAKALHDKLKSIDYESYLNIHENNVKRVIRALEFYYETGYPISKHNEEQKTKESPYQFLYFVIDDDREKLYNRIDRRVEHMIKNGLIEEVENLLNYGCLKDMTSMQGIGYKEIIPYLENQYSLDEAIYILKRDTRHFAKRQLTWFRREQNVTWVNKSQFNSLNLLLENILEEINKKGILIPTK